ncbi:MAG: bifunctional diaminohydroxyphosphoribosylaminopyrimidine deaminase/5-amino-6-(5-phosphoribosylamino)uracil reductase RibD [Flavobacteriaceae bacterium]
MNEEKLMKRCIEIGKSVLGMTYPNPNVGSLLFCDGKIISEGFTSKAGGNHSEINTIKNVKDQSLFKNSTLFVTLEPCCHFGKTPPCTNEIVKSGIKNVVIGCEDPNPIVKFKGIKYLKDHGVNVTYGILEDLCKDLHKRLIVYFEKKRPYIILKWAESFDGFIAPKIKNNKRPYWISNELSKQIVHKWRSQEHAIMIGHKTKKNDNAFLDVRNWNNINNRKFVVGRDLEDLEGFEIIETNGKILSANDLSKNLFNKKIQSIIIEGGLFTLNKFIESNIWDEARVFKSNTKIYDGTSSPKLNLNYHEKTQIDKDTLYHFKNYQ